MVKQTHCDEMLPQDEEMRQNNLLLIVKIIPRMRFRRRIPQNLKYNAAVLKRKDFDVMAAVNYEPPLPVYPTSYATTTPTAATSVGTTGDWKFDELLEMDGASLLTLLYKNQQVHAFSAETPPPPTS